MVKKDRLPEISCASICYHDFVKFTWPTYLLLILCYCLTPSNLRGQYILRWADDTSKVERFVSSDARLKEIQKVYLRHLDEGFLNARIDTFRNDSTLLATLVRGEMFNISSFSLLPDSTILSDPIVYQKKRAPAFSRGNILTAADKMLSDYENRGFPFASLRISSFAITNNQADLIYSVKPGPRILMDSLIIRSQDKLPQRYIRQYIEFRSGSPYQEDKLLRTTNRLRELPFVTVRQSPEIRFHENKADLFLFIEKKKANTFNGILGIRPDDRTGKVNLTGDAEIRLTNAFNGGEEFYLNWRKLQVQTQDLSTKLLLPYLFSTPVGLDGQLKIYKRDTTFTSVKTAAGLLFLAGGNNRIRIFVEKNISNQLSTFANALPLANVNSSLYGLSVQFEKLDYRFNPRKGFALQLEGATGSRKINATNLSDTEKSDAAQNVFRVEGQIDYYIPTWKKQCIYTGFRGAGIFTEGIFENEMYRIGGIRTLRGIDEESLFATSYVVSTIEYRLLFEENSALYLFADQSWYEKKGQSSFVSDIPLGFGAGVNFETKAGIFTFNYAVGKQFDNPILVRNAKISFGFRNLF
jgi:outer membrane protein assembly factor BamA